MPSASIVVMLAMGALALAACGQPEPSPTATALPATSAPDAPVAASLTPGPTAPPAPTPTATPEPTPTATVTPTATPQPSVEREDLPGMVLTEEQVNFFFPQVKLDVEGSGYEDNEAAAEDTIDPADTAEVIASRGRIDGYQHDLEDREVLFSGQGALDRPAAFLSAVDLFSSDASAKAFLLRQLEDFRRLAGTELEEGLTLSGFEELPALGLGPNAFAGRATMKQAAFETPFTMELIAWQRGPLVARVSTIALDSENRSSAMTRLAGAMDKRIDGVLAGEITATPLVVEPAAARLGSEDAAKQAGFDLAAMMLTEADLPAGTRMTSDGYQEKSDVVSAYERDFRSGTISNISVDVELKSSTFDAMAPIQVFKAMETKAVGDLFSQAFCRPGDAA